MKGLLLLAGLSLSTVAASSLAGEVVYKSRDQIMLDGNAAIGKIGEIAYTVDTVTPDYLIVHGEDDYMTWMYFRKKDKPAIKKLRTDKTYTFRFRVKRISGSDLFLNFVSAED